MNSGEHWQQNLEAVESYVQQASSLGIQLLLFPENMLNMGCSTQQRKDIAQHYDSMTHHLSQLARQHQMHMIAGSLMAPHEQKLSNRSVVFSNQGQILATYDKIHLFDAVVEHDAYRESDAFVAGTQPVCVNIKHWNIGLSICYDLRFPELYRHYAAQGCHILCVPAAFTYQTGQAHWQCLLRSRAIENQCYVLAAGQWGKHTDGRQTWGNSMIIDPWGKVLTQKAEGSGLVMANLDMTFLKSVRQQLPVLQHRRLH